MSDAELPPLPPDLDEELGRMGARLDAEVRAERAEYEAMAVQAAWRARRITDVAREWMVHGDTLEVMAGGLVLTGEVMHTGADVLVVSAPPRGLVDVAASADPLLRLVARATSGGVPPGRGAKTFNARLTEHEVSGERRVLRLTDGLEMDGRILAVAVDHVLLDSRQGQRVVPLPRIAMTWSAPAA